MGPIPPAPIPMPPATRAPNRGASTVLLRRVECAHHFGGRKVRRPAPWVEPRDYLLDDRLRVVEELTRLKVNRFRERDPRAPPSQRRN